MTVIKWQPSHLADTVFSHKTDVDQSWVALWKIFALDDDEYRIILDRADAPKLEAMHAVTEHRQSIYSELAVLVVTYGQIEIRRGEGSLSHAPSLADLNEQLEGLKEQDERLQAGVNYWKSMATEADKRASSEYNTGTFEINRLREQIEKLKEANGVLEAELYAIKERGAIVRDTKEEARLGIDNFRFQLENQALRERVAELEFDYKGLSDGAGNVAQKQAARIAELETAIQKAFDVPLCDANIPNITGHELVKDMMDILLPYTENADLEG